MPKVLRLGPRFCTAFFTLPWTQIGSSSFDKCSRCDPCCAVDKGLPMVKGLREWIQWIDEHGIKKCAVTNAPKKNAEVMLEALGLE